MENSYGKINILLQTYISRGEVDSFSLISDLSYVAQVRKTWLSTDSQTDPCPGQMVILFHAQIPNSFASNSRKILGVLRKWAKKQSANFSAGITKRT